MDKDSIRHIDTTYTEFKGTWFIIPMLQTRAGIIRPLRGTRLTFPSSPGDPLDVLSPQRSALPVCFAESRTAPSPLERFSGRNKGIHSVGGREGFISRKYSYCHHVCRSVLLQCVRVPFESKGITGGGGNKKQKQKSRVTSASLWPHGYTVLLWIKREIIRRGLRRPES